jgi:hypothetical protein
MTHLSIRSYLPWLKLKHICWLGTVMEHTVHWATAGLSSINSLRVQWVRYPMRFCHHWWAPVTVIIDSQLLSTSSAAADYRIFNSNWGVSTSFSRDCKIAGIWARIGSDQQPGVRLDLYSLFHWTQSWLHLVVSHSSLCLHLFRGHFVSPSEGITHWGGEANFWRTLWDWP